VPAGILEGPLRAPLMSLVQDSMTIHPALLFGLVWLLTHPMPSSSSLLVGRHLLPPSFTGPPLAPFGQK